MDVWRGPVPADVDFVTGALQEAALWNVNDVPSNPQTSSVEPVGWAGQTLPQLSAAGVVGDREVRQDIGVTPPKPQPRGTTQGRACVRNRNDGRRTKGYRKLWEQATKGAGSSTDEKSAVCDLTVEELVRLITALPPTQSVVLAVGQSLHYLDSRALAALLKELAKVGSVDRAIELFNWLRSLPLTDELSGLCDVYTYTTAISIMGHKQQLRKALELVAEMRSRGLQCNVHTYSSLMNVCIKCGELDLSLDIYSQMKAEGLKPNIVTYNTLIDVYGKTGQWDRAVAVIDLVQEEGLEPEVRTYNTAIIACNMCGQPQEALKVYEKLLRAGLTPISTTYTALISAYGKAGQLDKALEVFNQMVHLGCERSVITYSALISACEKGGKWGLALELFDQMHKEGCEPNTVTYNSLITACAQGAQCERASQVFQQMKERGCRPDVVTYSALISAYDRGGQWRNAVKIFEQMQQQGCKPDSIVYQTIIDLLWHSGVSWAQSRAVQLYHIALRNWPFRFLVQVTAHDSVVDVVVPACSSSVAVLSLHKWLTETRFQIEKEPCLLKEKVLLSLGRVPQNRDMAAGAKAADAVLTILKGLESPFELQTSEQGLGFLEVASPLLTEWLLGPKLAAALFIGSSPVGLGAKCLRTLEQLGADRTLEIRCVEAYATVKQFECTHRLSFQAMCATYRTYRPQFVETAVALGGTFKLKDETVYDAVLLMDRAMSTGIQLSESLSTLFVASLIHLAAIHSELPENVPQPLQLDTAINFPVGSVARMEMRIRLTLGNDLSAISSVRCLNLYLERLGTNPLDGIVAHQSAANAVQLLRLTLPSTTFLNFRPSIVAAAVLYVERRSRGAVPLWPVALAQLTGMYDLGVPEFIAAIKATESLVQANSSVFVPPQTQEGTCTLGISSTDQVVSPAQVFTAIQGVSPGEAVLAPAGQVYTLQAVSSGSGEAILTPGIVYTLSQNSSSGESITNIYSIHTTPSGEKLVSAGPLYALQGHTASESLITAPQVYTMNPTSSGESTFSGRLE